MDRFSRWPEVFPITDMKAETVAREFYNGWICRFGVPAKVTTDQGRQFESELFRELSKLMGSERQRTTPYHPCANGMIERFHRTLKSALTAKLNIPNWTEHLPTILLGLRTSTKEDLNSSSAELVYGTTLRIPGQMIFTANKQNELPQSEFLSNLHLSFENYRITEGTNHSKNNFFVFKDLKDSSHVFVRTDSVRKPLVPPYSGPHLILERHPKFMKLMMNGKEKMISIDRIKPAFLENNLEENIINNKTIQRKTSPHTITRSKPKGTFS